MSGSRVRVLVDGRVSVVLTDKGRCRTCGEVVVYSPMAKMWLHVLRLKGEKHYDHEAKARKR